ncbi:MAG: Gfo/Idh/MocA family oxidoreductase [Bryobacteraceae bacterium]
MRKLKTAIFGTGFMGKVHTEAIRRLGNVEVVGVAAHTLQEAQAFADAVGIPRATADYRTLLADPEIDAVHVCTPNALHYPISKAALEAGKNVLCEKPLTMTAADAADLVALAAKTQLANCVNHNLRFYPLVQQIRSMIAAGELGEILIVQGTYFQDWLLYDTDWNWRVNTPENGKLRAMGDIGSHWMDMIQHLTGLKITALCADLQTFHKTRKRPKMAVETFAGKKLQPSDYEPVAIDTDDFGAVLLHLGDRARGNFSVSQMSAGRKNRFEFEIFGSKCGVAWNQERPDELWIGQRNAPNQLMVKDPSLMEARAAGFADLPGGHSEGYDDAHKQMFRRFYRRVADPTAPVEYPTFEDGLLGMKLLEKVLESATSRAWVTV